MSTALSSTAFSRLALIVVLLVAWTGQAAMASSLMSDASHSEHHVPKNHSPNTQDREHHSHDHHSDHDHHDNAADEMSEMAMECCPGTQDCADGHCIQLLALTSRFSLPTVALLPTLQGSHASPVAVSASTFRPPIFA